MGTTAGIFLTSYPAWHAQVLVAGRLPAAMVALELRIRHQGPIGLFIRQIKSLRHDVTQVLGMKLQVAASCVATCDLPIHRQPAFLDSIFAYLMYANFPAQFIS
jgi:hypothetical protein